ncbi:MAG TPA: asparagine synthase (glutamine-hydrolyzing) [Gemmatimonadales bacterium]|nr:asparagine synthase (glutamine-hydrolyzing) [Gemmatimonadales bacterium]
MCGIAGIVAAPDLRIDEALDRMVSCLRHRGPDGDGVWLGRCGERQVGLGQTRLAILDLTDAGRQPMWSDDGNYALTYNGEVYNYLELRAELSGRGRVFRSGCDTEVVLEALIEWGPAAFERFNGMWALALLDRREATLLLARDRMGVKPLYLHRDEAGTVYFGSEVKTILQGSCRRFGVNPIVAERYLQQQQLDAQPETFFAGITELPAGTHLTLDLRRPAISLPAATPYWRLPLEDRFAGTAEARIEAVRELFLDGVRLRLRSDVPVGVLLSGGIDSSSIAVAMQRALGRDADLHALAAVSDEPRYSEDRHIDIMTAHLGCPAHKIRVPSDPTVLARHLEHAIYQADEPLGGLSPVAHYLVMQRARELGITVLLTGQGADELLCGYLKYLGFQLQGLARGGRLIEAARLFGGFAARGTVLRQFRLADARRYLPRAFQVPAVDIRGPGLRTGMPPLSLGLGVLDLVARQAEDLTRFSVPALLHNEDRMSMAHSREMRVPFLDYRLVSLLLPMGPEWKLRDGWTKWIFRRAMERDLPAAITWRKDKQGFITPEDRWVAGALRPWIEARLAEPMLTAEWGLIDQPALRRRYALYLAGGDRRRMRAQDILCPLMLELWARRFAPSLSGAA